MIGHFRGVELRLRGGKQVEMCPDTLTECCQLDLVTLATKEETSRGVAMRVF